MTESDNKVTKNMPFGVKLLSVLSYISAGILFIYGLIYVFLEITLLAFKNTIVNRIGAVAVNKSISISATDLNQGAQTTELLFLAGIIIFIGLAVLLLFVGRGLWKGRNWSRILLIVLSVILVVLTLIYLASGYSLLVSLLILVINIWIAGYLLLSEKAKTAFGK